MVEQKGLSIVPWNLAQHRDFMKPSKIGYLIYLLKHSPKKDDRKLREDFRDFAQCIKSDISVWHGLA